MKRLYVSLINSINELDINPNQKENFDKTKVKIAAHILLEFISEENVVKIITTATNIYAINP
jgi:hypothetical protein